MILQYHDFCILEKLKQNLTCLPAEIIFGMNRRWVLHVKTIQIFSFIENIFPKMSGLWVTWARGPGQRDQGPVSI